MNRHKPDPFPNAGHEDHGCFVGKRNAVEELNTVIT